MDWLNDKKNQPIIAAIAAVVIVGVGVFMYLTMFRKPSEDQPPAATTQPAETAEAEEMAISDPSLPPTSAPAAAQPAVPPPTGAEPMETWRDDPFLPVGYKTSPKLKTRPPIPDFPFFHFPTPPRPEPDELKDEPPQPIRRLAGVMINDQVCAIIEWNGVSQVYQPGQMLEDGLAIVDKIEADKVTLKTRSKPSRYLVVRLAAAPSGRTSAASITSTSEPTSPRPISRPFRPGDRPRPTY